MVRPVHFCRELAQDPDRKVRAEAGTDQGAHVAIWRWRPASRSEGSKPLSLCIATGLLLIVQTDVERAGIRQFEALVRQPPPDRASRQTISREGCGSRFGERCVIQPSGASDLIDRRFDQLCYGCRSDLIVRIDRPLGLPEQNASDLNP